MTIHQLVLLCELLTPLTRIAGSIETDDKYTKEDAHRELLPVIQQLQEEIGGCELKKKEG